MDVIYLDSEWEIHLVFRIGNTIPYKIFGIPIPFPNPCLSLEIPYSNSQSKLLWPQIPDSTFPVHEFEWVIPDSNRLEILEFTLCFLRAARSNGKMNESKVFPLSPICPICWSLICIAMHWTALEGIFSLDVAFSSSTSVWSQWDPSHITSSLIAHFVCNYNQFYWLTLRNNECEKKAQCGRTEHTCNFGWQVLLVMTNLFQFFSTDAA